MSLAEAPEGTSVSVPQVDDDSFNAFFSKVPDSVSLNSEDAPELNEADFDHISVAASQLWVMPAASCSLYSILFMKGA